MTILKLKCGHLDNLKRRIFIHVYGYVIRLAQGTFRVKEFCAKIVGVWGYL
jgi:hypothetical protein